RRTTISSSPRPNLLSRAETPTLSPSSSTPRPHPPCSGSARTDPASSPAATRTPSTRRSAARSPCRRAWRSRRAPCPCRPRRPKKSRTAHPAPSALARPTSRPRPALVRDRRTACSKSPAVRRVDLPSPELPIRSIPTSSPRPSPLVAVRNRASPDSRAPLEEVVDGPPVDARGLHRDMRAARRGEPVRQAQQLARGGPERPHLLAALGPGAGRAETGRDTRLVDVEAAADGVEHLHRTPSLSAQGGEALTGKKILRVLSRGRDATGRGALPRLGPDR